MFYVELYLFAIVLANLSVAFFGAGAALFNAFAFIGLDLSTRDKLHELWRGHNLRGRMLALIALGSTLSFVLTYAFSQDAARIAVASFVAFLCAGIVDALTYHALKDRAYLLKVNGSNVLGATVDSLLFFALWPFGFSWKLVGLHIAAKVLGGFVWSILLKRGR